MVAKKTDRKNGRWPFGKFKRAVSTVGQHLARQGKRLRWDRERNRVVIVDR